jgi:hypothetical protein
VSLFHPVPRDSQTGGLTRRQLEQARKVEADTALELHRYKHGAHFKAQIDIYDSQALADANQAALSSEMDVLDYGLSRAGMSAAKIEMTARAAQRMGTINHRRIMRKFGEVA